MRARIVALSVSLALGSALMAPAAVAVAEPSASTILPVAECKLTSPISRFNEGFVLDDDAAAPKGTLTAQIIYADFPDNRGGAEGEFWLEHLRADTERAVANLEAQAGGALDVVVREHAEWVTLPHETTSYPESGDAAWGSRVFFEFVTDAVAAADPVVDFAGADVVWVFYPWIAPLAARAQAENFIPLSLDGDEVLRAITLPKAGSDAAVAPIIVHETGHTFGLPDLYDSVSPGGTSSHLGSWDPMSDGWGDGHELEAWEFMGWHLWRLGWIRDDQVTCVGSSPRVDVTLDALTRRGSSAIVVIPTSDHRAVVVESRKAERYDASIIRPGVLITVVDTEVGSGEGPVRVGPRDGTEFPTNPEGFANSTLVVGDRYTDPVAGFTVSVIANTAASDTVRIEPADAPTEPPIDPDPDPAPPVDSPSTPAGAVATLPPTGPDPTIGVLVSIVLLLAGAAGIGVARTRSTSPERRSTPN